MGGIGTRNNNNVCGAVSPSNIEIGFVEVYRFQEESRQNLFVKLEVNGD